MDGRKTFKTMEKVVIQVVLYKGSNFFEKLLPSINTQTYKNISCLFWENSLDDEEFARVTEGLKQLTIPYELIRGTENTGFSAHNALFQKHDASYVFVFNQDAYLADDCIEQLVGRMQGDERIAAITPLVYRWNETGQKEIDTSGLIYDCLGHVIDRTSEEGGEVWGISGAAAMYRRSALRRIRPEGNIYDPRFWMYKEDVDTSIRLQKVGYIAWCEDKALAYHIRAIQHVPGGYINRIKAERKRPEKIRMMTYVNQWRIYKMHAKNASVGDLVKSLCYEFLRTLMVFLVSPKLFIQSWKLILNDTPYELS